MQTRQAITITNGLPTVGYNLVPLIILSMIKDAFEDYKRHKADEAENSRTVSVYSPKSGKFVEKLWKAVYPGEIVKL